MPQSVAVRLADAKLLLTGASGFLGKAVLATWLREVPGSGTITLLLRAPDDDAAHQRLVEQVLTSEPFAGGLADEALASGRLRALAADLAAEGLGGLDSQELAGTDVAIHCAASVSFEQPLDDILELNVLGARRLSDALRAAGCDDVHLLHVSTAYAAGQRTGLVLERPYGSGTSEPWVDLDAELAVAKEWRRELESQSRLPAQQKRFVADAQEELGPAGALHVGQRAEWGRHGWMWSELVERGRQRARALGWSDTYTLSKALAERALVQSRLRHLTIVRPTIIESALEQPYPGWMELKVTDPVLLSPTVVGFIPRSPATRRRGSTSCRSTWSPTSSWPPRPTPRRTARAASRWPAARATRCGSASSRRSSPATSGRTRCPTRTACPSRSPSGASPPTRTSAGRWTAATRPLRWAASSSPQADCPTATTSSARCTSSAARSSACAG